jgi:cobalt-zinc-cadmium efflux system outer membrane protein
MHPAHPTLSALLCLLAGCFAPPAGTTVELRSPERSWLPAEAATPAADPDELIRTTLAAPELTMAAALAVALARHPTVAAVEARIEVARAERLAELLYPNPSATLTVVRDDADSLVPQVWLEFEQPIVVSDRRDAAATSTQAAADAAAWDVVLRKHELVAEVRKQFHLVLAAQDEVGLARQTAAVGEELLRVAEGLLAAERIAELEALRVRATVARERAAIGVAEAHLAAARARLLGVMGLAEGALPPCAPTGQPPDTLPPPERLLAVAHERYPALRAADARIAAARAAIELAEAKAVPDLTLAAGYGQSFDPFASLWTVGVGLPLPMFDVNQAERAAAEAQLTAAEADRAALEHELSAGLHEALAEYEGAAAALRTVRDDLGPAAEQAWRRTEVAYREGGVDHSTLLNAERARLEARTAEQEARRDCWLALVRIEALTGPLALLEVEAP